jgi:DegV family protein with EDD domain
MQIVTDSGADLAPEQTEGLEFHIVPLSITLAGVTYTSGVDLQPAEFYTLLESSGQFPTTSQPSAGDFAALYRRLAQVDPEILSIHISSGLSGTLEAARAGAALVPEAHVTFFDSRTLSCPQGWMVQAAVQARQASWSLEQILERLTLIQAQTQGLFTLDSLKYLIHGGRISHLKALAASVLKIRPVLGPDKVEGRYVTFSQDMTLKRAIQRIPELVAKMFPDCKRLRVQLLHGHNPEGLELLRAAMQGAAMGGRFECLFEPAAVIAPVLGAHTGPSVIGLAVGDPQVFAGLI